MPATVIVGGQFGSEGKGKIAAFLAPHIRHSVRTGGPNAGHTIVDGAHTFVLRHLPCAVIRPSVQLYLGAGAIIDPGVLFQEINEHHLTPERLCIDPQCIVISTTHKTAEADLIRRIGSTGKGVGSAVSTKVLRGDDVVLARDVDSLHPYIAPVAERLHRALARGDRLLLEGTQGTGLSLHHGYYPYVTSRDVTAGSLCGEAGIGPTVVDCVLLVVRTYPIRVAGPSGPLYREVTWDAVTIASGYPTPLLERTTVTQNVRRVGEFELDAVIRSARLNGATDIALTFADYIDANVRGARHTLSAAVERFITSLEDAAGIPVSLVSTGPDTGAIVVRNGTRMLGSS